jgi:hypothetical protein
MKSHRVRQCEGWIEKDMEANDRDIFKILHKHLYVGTETKILQLVQPVSGSGFAPGFSRLRVVFANSEVLCQFKVYCGAIFGNIW